MRVTSASAELSPGLDVMKPRVCKANSLSSLSSTITSIDLQVKSRGGRSAFRDASVLVRAQTTHEKGDE